MSKTFSASKISASEWEIMDIVWDKHPITAPEVFALLGKDQNWSQKTVNTFLARLAVKEALAVEKRYNMNFYSPLVSREESVTRESRSFLSRFFQGGTGALLAHFCEQGNLSDSELAELERLISSERSKRKKNK
jgi:BlaI family penicillinase repressor